MRKTFLPTGRLIVGRDAPAQSKQSGFIDVSGGQSGRPDVGICLRLIGLDQLFQNSQPIVIGLQVGQLFQNSQPIVDRLNSAVPKLTANS